MAFRLSVDLGGVDKQLASLERRLQRQVWGNALRAGQRVIRDEARSLAPVKTGKLRDSIKVMTGRSRKPGRTVVHLMSSDLAFSGETFYGAFQEFGWKSGGRKSGLAPLARRFAKQLQKQSRENRKLGPGMGLQPKGTEFRKRQEAYFVTQGHRMAIRSGAKPRREIPGEHFLETAFKERGEVAAVVMQREFMAVLSEVIAVTWITG